MITFDDGKQIKRFEDFKLRPIRSHSRPRSGGLSQRTSHINGQSGDWYFGTEIGVKSYNLTVTAHEFDWIELEKILDELNSFLLDSKGKPKLLKATWDNTGRFSFVRLANPIIPNVDSVLEKIPIELVALDPHEYSEATSFDLERPLEYDKGNEYGAKSYPNTQSFKWIYAKHYSGIENYSSLDTEIRITIKGTVRSGKVTHLQSGIGIKFPDISNGTIIIDGANYNLKINGVDTIIDGDFFEMVTGNNGFLFEAETVNANVTFDWYHKFT